MSTRPILSLPSIQRADTDRFRFTDSGLISYSSYFSSNSRRTSEGLETGLLARAQNGDPAVTQVSMWETKTVDIPPGQTADVFTYGLGGCTAIAVLSKHGDGTRGITLSHYPPLSTDDQLSKLKRALNTTSHSISNPNVQHEMYVITPYDWVRDHEERGSSRPRSKRWLHVSIRRRKHSYLKYNPRYCCTPKTGLHANLAHLFSRSLGKATNQSAIKGPTMVRAVFREFLSSAGPAPLAQWIEQAVFTRAM